MENKTTIKFLIALAIQIAIVLAIILFKVSVLTGGTDVFVSIEPIDPRDPLRGDYVTFNLSISSVDTYYLNDRFDYFSDESLLSAKVGSTIYVVLEESRGIFSPSYISFKEPLYDGEIFIKGIVTSANVNTINIKYGVEEYFIPEGSGQISFWNKDAVAHIVVDENGNPVLKEVIIDGEVWP